MKNFVACIFHSAWPLIFLLVGCSEKDNQDTEPLICYDCALECYLDSVSWNASITKCLISPHDPPDSYEVFSFYMTEENPVDGYADVLSITSIPAFQGHYEIIAPVPEFHLLTAELIAHQSPSLQREKTYSDSDSLESYIDVEYVNFETNVWKVSFHLEMNFFLHWTYEPDIDTYPKYFVMEGTASGKFSE